MLYNDFYVSPIGNIILSTDEKSLLSLAFIKEIPIHYSGDIVSPVIKETQKQLDLYFSGQLQKFELPIRLETPKFQKQVLEEIQKIPYGHIITYAQLAQRLGSVRLTRAVASANANNPILLVLPCHRVVGKDGDMAGYAGEIWRKEWLLNQEGALTQNIFNSFSIGRVY